MKRLTNITQIVESHLCLGCGACSSICESDSIKLHNVLSQGIRPYVADSSSCTTCDDCLEVCPGFKTDLRQSANRTGIIPELYEAYGPVLEIWEGHASDEEIRFEGSSGGALTALSLYCLEREHMQGVLHIGQDPMDATQNVTQMSRTRADLLRKTGSRYAPASACDRLREIEDANAPCVFIGQPSELAAYRKAEKLRPKLRKNTGLLLSFFCAGTPSRLGTQELLKRHNVPLKSLERIRYRGKGWPGFFTTRNTGEDADTQHIPYRETWQFLRNYRPLSTFLFPDSSGEDADISCGDPWYHETKTSNKGSSLIVVRTERGRDILSAAVKAGYLKCERRAPHHLRESQGSLAKKRGEVFSRIAANSLLGLRTPGHKGFSLFKNWLTLPHRSKLRSFLSALKRAKRDQYHKPLKVRAEADTTPHKE